ncbi:alpha/beta hydrolase [Spirosoma sp.]|uniref:alpha/beta hydrolase n=1 Tax=Spirosoma sp. TaxID=1899569 RepID=UPI00260C085F|nr:alpha/beta hydrolase [Spirosoma sp.]MCX6215864.1 alpha/beta hydrolase [Spirosoma sp.]
MKRALTAVLIFLSINTMAQNQEVNVEILAIESSRYWLDLDYVGDGLIGHKLDIHLPKTGKAPFPVVICIYGSAWRANSWKANTFNEGGIGQKLLGKGFAVVSINYRSSADAQFPAQIQDVKAAIRFVRANAPKLGLDGSFISVTGWSSGGHLAAMAGTTNGIKKKTINGLDVDIEGALGKFTQADSHVDAVVDWFGPTDFLIMDACGSTMPHNDAKSPESILVGGPIQENKDKVALANPISYVRKGNPPFLIFHGDKDPLVPHCQSEKLYEKQQTTGVESKLVIVPGGGHGPGVMIDTYYNQALAFLANQLEASKKK